MPARLHIEGTPSAAWRGELDALAAVVSEGGHLWSCAGGELRIALDAERGATLARRDPLGRDVIRHAATPADLLPTVEALLAVPPHKPLPPTTAPPPLAAARPGIEGPALPPASTEPRLVVEASAGVRYSGTLRSVWATGGLRIAVPLDAWSVGAWARYGVPYVIDATPFDFSASDLAIGLSVGRRLVAAGLLDLRATFDPAIAFVTMEGGTESNLAEGAKVDARLGLALRATLRFTRMWRGVVALDGEIAPASAAKARRIDPALPPLPAYSAGVSFGLDVAIR